MLELKKKWYGTDSGAASISRDISRVLESAGYTKHSLIWCLFMRPVEGSDKFSFIMVWMDDLGMAMPSGGVESARVRKILEK